MTATLCTPTRMLTWYGPDGSAISFGSVDGVIGAMGRQIAGMPPVRASVLTVPLQPGGRWQQVDHGPRDVVVPVHLIKDRTVIDALMRSLDPTRGTGTLRVTDSEDGIERDLRCRYIDGLSITEHLDPQPYWSASLIFRAVSPYWASAEVLSLVLAPGGSPTFFPIFPLVLGGSELTTSATVDNTGQAPMWPVWTITGPGSAVIVENVTTGMSLELDATLAAGETVVIDTRPGTKTVVSSVAGDLFYKLAPTSSMWSFPVGSSSVALTMTGATTASKLVGQWSLQWLSV